MISSFKEHYIKCCVNCVAISQQLLVKIDSGVIMNYSSLTELLVNLKAY